MSEKKKKETEVVATPTDRPAEVTGLIAQAVALKADVATLERLFALQKEVNAEAAKTAYVRAISAFQSACPVIKKTKKVMNKGGASVRYQYAPLDAIVDQIKVPLKNVGLSYRWETENGDKLIKAVCTITHELGHSESSSFTVPVDTNEYMTSPQRYASALTFAKRYALINALGISTGEEDTDATDVEKSKEPRSEKSKIVFCLKTLGKPSNTKEKVEEAVKSLTGLELKDENLGEILSRLEVLVQEKNEYDHSKNV